MSSMLPQQYCLRWKYHHSNLQTMFSQLLDRGCFCDVTLACEGQLIRAHRVVLCACSTFFDSVLSNYASERDPIIIMKDVTFAEVKSLIEFMYKGEINVEHAHLASLLKTADDLKIKGLAEVSWRDDDDGPPPPMAAAEFHSPVLNAADNYTHDTLQHQHQLQHHQQQQQQQRSSPCLNEHREHERKSPVTPDKSVQLPRMPTLTPIPSTSISIAAASPPVDHYFGPKRKRGRPPLDDAYDVFNIRKLAQYAANMEPAHRAYLESTRHYADGQQLQQHNQHQQPQPAHSAATTATCATSPPLTTNAAAAAAYQQHIHQQQTRQRHRNRCHQQQPPPPPECDDHEIEDPQTDPEWINSNLEVNVAVCETSNNNDEDDDVDAGRASRTNAGGEGEQLLEHERDNEEIEFSATLPPPPPPAPLPTKRQEKKHREHSPERKDKYTKMRALRRRSSERSNERDEQKSSLENDEVSPVTPTTIQTAVTVASVADDEEEPGDVPTTVPQPVEEMECKQLAVVTTATTASASTSSSSVTATSGTTGVQHHSSSSSKQPPPPMHHAHFSKYGPPPDGYLINEHGILMTHDFVHAPTVAIPTTPATANGSQEHTDYIDIKLEDYDAADLRLTSEEMTQWQDVIKMDDYLAKGRRPQFWEEPFTKRVLDAIKNKRLEMKKASRILGVSYGTLYGRYREVYGCLKHPYSGTTLRPSASSQLAVQPRFDLSFRNASVLSAQFELSKIRTKDLSELWTRPQI